MNKNVLGTGIRAVKNVGRFNFGTGALDDLPGYVATMRARAAQAGGATHVVFFVDEFFEGQPRILARLCVESQDHLEFVATKEEPTTTGIDACVERLRERGFRQPATIIGLGGGCAMDTAKAVANLLTNPGNAADYQGWDLVKNPGIHKIGVPSISGTGAESTRTCVMKNPSNGLKLGMNSDHTVFDHIILDPALSATVPKAQYFFTGMDAYIHCVESLAGSYRNVVGDAYSRETLRLCREVFLHGDMMEDRAREQLMVASYLGGCAIATSYVGVIHPLSAGLSVVLGLHHCVANCITMRAMAEFYPEAYDEFWRMAERQKVEVPSGVARGLTIAQYRSLYDASVIHEKPLTNALGSEYRSILTFEKVVSLFEQM